MGKQNASVCQAVTPALNSLKKNNQERQLVRYLRMLILLRRGVRHGSFVKIAETLSVTSATFNFCI